MNVKAKKKMSKKLIASIVVLALVSLASILGIVTVLALSQRNIDSSIFIRFTAIDIDGEVEAQYRVGTGEWKPMGDKHVFNAADEEENAQMNPGNISLSSANNFVEFKYTFRNFGDADYTGILTLDEVVTENNMEIQYKYNNAEYSTSSYGLVVEGVDTAENTETNAEGKKYSEMTYYIKVGVKELSKSARYSSDFFWLLERYDGEITGESAGQVIPIATSEYVANGDGTYSAKYAGANINSASTSADSSYKIENVWIIPNNLGSAPVTKVIPGDDLPSNTKVVLGDNVTTIEEDTFKNDINLVDIVIGNKVITIPNEGFKDCENLRSVTIPDNTTSIGDMAFSGCLSLTSIVIPDSITSIGSAAFYNCISLINMEIPNSVTSIDDYAFAYCWNLTNIKLSNRLQWLSIQMFSHCSSLKEITIPESVISLAAGVFSGCSSLRNIVIPESVIYIGEYCFQGCANLVNAIFKNPNNWIEFNTYTKLSLENSETAAIYLKDTYCSVSWERA